MTARPRVGVLGLFLTTIIVPSAALGWLSFRLAQQDQALQAGRLKERLETAVGRATSELQLRISHWDRHLLAVAGEDGPSDWPHMGDAALVWIGNGGFHRVSTEGLPYDPGFQAAIRFAPDALSDVEYLEFVRKDYAAAHESALRLSALLKAEARATALLISARNLRKMGRFADALATYRLLANTPGYEVDQTPAELLALAARCELFSSLGMTQQLHSEARLLDRGLRSGRWRLSRATYRFYRGELEQWIATPDSGDPIRQALAQAACVLWEDWGSGQRAPLSGIRLLSVEGYTILAMWRRIGSRIALLLAGPKFVESQFTSHPVGKGTLEDTRITIVPESDDPPVSSSGPLVVRTVPSGGITWTVSAAPADARREAAAAASRTRLLSLALALLGAVIAASTIFTARALRRESEISQLKSDFVAAVSHDFRTPLTSMMQAAELIAEDRVSDDSQRSAYANLLVRETGRLKGLVDTLIEFARVEEGARAYCLRAIEYGAFFRQVLESFSAEAQAAGYSISAQLPSEDATGQGDHEALARALHNLLLNAMQYSPDCRTIWFEAHREGTSMVIAVRDRGIGVPDREKRRIFRKFARGSNASAVRHQGSGIGLSIVEHVVRAHRGSIRLESAWGKGSKFTLTLPLDG